MLNNNELRTVILKKRREFKESAMYAEYCQSICQRIRETEEFQKAENVMIYLPLGGEVDVRDLYTEEKNFYIPVTKGVVITPARYTPKMEFVKGEYGIVEPKNPCFADKSQLDLAVIPLVGADRNRNRMGFGKGCYDRFLENADLAKIGVAFGFQIAEKIEKKPTDIPMDYIITESECI